MKTRLSAVAFGLILFLVSTSTSEAQAKTRLPAEKRSGRKSKVVAVDINRLEALPIESGKLKVIATSDDTNGAFAMIERTQDPCYKTTWHRHDNFEESFYVLDGVWTVQIRDAIHEFPAGSYVLIPRGTPHGQGNFTSTPVRLLVIVTPGGFEGFYRERAELFKTKGGDKAELEKGLEALRNKYVQVIDYTWKTAKECRSD